MSYVGDTSINQLIDHIFMFSHTLELNVLGFALKWSSGSLYYVYRDIIITKCFKNTWVIIQLITINLVLKSYA